MPPNEIDALLEEGARLLPGRGRGALVDVIFQYPATEKIALFATFGMFYAEPESKQTVVVGGSGFFERKDDEADIAASIGVKFDLGKNFDVRIAFERYDIDGIATDFTTASFGYHFGHLGE